MFTEETITNTESLGGKNLVILYTDQMEERRLSGQRFHQSYFHLYSFFGFLKIILV